MQGLFSKIGPGAIVASATIGAGETVLAVRVGAWAGYDLLWLILLAVVTKSVLTLYLLGRYAAVTGEPIGQRLVHLPGPRGWFLWLILCLEAVVAPFVFVVIAAPCGRLMANVLATAGLEVPYQWLAIVFVTLALTVAMAQRYETLERSQIAVCLVLLVGTVTGTVLARPDPVGIFRGLVAIGSFPDYPDWVPAGVRGRSQLLEMASVFGYAGSIALNYIVYANWVLLKGWTVRSGPVTSERLREALTPLRWDVGINAGIILIVTAAFLVAGAAILNPLHRIPSGFDLLTEQAEIFRRISPLMIPLYYVTILTALWGTLNALPDIYARGAHGFLTALVPSLSGLRPETVMRVFCSVTLPLTWIFIATGTTPIVLVDLVALFSTNVAVALASFAAVWLDTQLPPERRASRWVVAATVVAAIVISVMSLLSAREVLARYV